jgi:hypothetical protein
MCVQLPTLKKATPEHVLPESNYRPNIPDAMRREYGGFIIKDGRNGRTGSRAEDPFTLIGAAWLTENAAIAFPVVHAADRPPRGHRPAARRDGEECGRCADRAVERGMRSGSGSWSRRICYTTMLYQFAEPFGVARVTRAI